MQKFLFFHHHNSYVLVSIKKEKCYARNKNLTQYQKDIISETIEWLGDDVNTQELTRKLNGDERLEREDPLRFLVNMYQDTSNGRLSDFGEAADTELRQEMVSKLTERYKTDENPEPFAGVNLEPNRITLNNNPSMGINQDVENPYIEEYNNPFPIMQLNRGHQQLSFAERLAQQRDRDESDPSRTRVI